MLAHTANDSADHDRVRLPNSMNPLFPSKILVSTGPRFRDAGCTENIEVEVEMGEQDLNFRGPS
jgi:hypothetical protein